MANSAAPQADFGVFIGRFQPLHIGHEHVIRQALGRVARLIVLIGSANVARDPRNPFTFRERAAMLRSSFAYEMAEGRVIVAPLNDHPDSDSAWVAEVQRRVHAIVREPGNGGGLRKGASRDVRIALTGYGKDASSYYLTLFPEWENIQIDSQYGTFSSTDVRARYFQRIPDVPASVLSAGVAKWLDAFKLGAAFRGLLEEMEHAADHPQQVTGPVAHRRSIIAAMANL